MAQVVIGHVGEDGFGIARIYAAHPEAQSEIVLVCVECHAK